MAELMRRGFCPGVWAPMPSGDGLLVRVRVPRGRLNTNQIRGLSSAARRHGNGLVELTRRANLQLRGVTQEALPDLQAELLQLKLAPSTREEERRPTLSVCPLAGLDLRCPSLELLADALDAMLASPELTRPLSEKFSVLLSGGSSLFEGLDFDLRVEASRSRPGWALVSVAGTPLGACREPDLAETVQRLLGWLGASVPEHARMRPLLDAQGSTALSAALAPLLDPAEPEAPWTATTLGFHSGVRSWFGLELPFGALDAADWDGVAELAERFGSGDLRLAPARVVLLPDVRERDAQRLAEQACARRFGVERRASEPRLVACSGAPACRSAQGETRLLATELAALLGARGPEPLTLHVSGCEKSCAWSGAADITLLHGTDGCRLGFGASVAETARTQPLAPQTLRSRLAAYAGGVGP